MLTVLINIAVTAAELEGFPSALNFNHFLPQEHSV
jgi:hypothetical protein